MRTTFYLAGVLVAAGVGVAAGADDCSAEVTTHKVDDDRTIVIIEHTPRDAPEYLEAVETVAERISINGQADLAEACVENAREHCLDGDDEAVREHLTDVIDKRRARQQSPAAPLRARRLNLCGSRMVGAPGIEPGTSSV